jgi:hypothetical protein
VQRVVCAASGSAAQQPGPAEAAHGGAPARSSLAAACGSLRGVSAIRRRGARVRGAAPVAHAAGDALQRVRTASRVVRFLAALAVRSRGCRLRRLILLVCMPQGGGRAPGGGCGCVALRETRARAQKGACVCKLACAAAMEPHMLVQLETVCESLYKAQDAAQRQQSEQARAAQPSLRSLFAPRARLHAARAATTDTLRPACAPPTDVARVWHQHGVYSAVQSDSGRVQQPLRAALCRLLPRAPAHGEHAVVPGTRTRTCRCMRFAFGRAAEPAHALCSPQLRLDMRNYVLGYLAARGTALESFVTTGARAARAAAFAAPPSEHCVLVCSLQRSSSCWCVPPRSAGSTARRSRAS